MPKKTAKTTKRTEPKTEVCFCCLAQDGILKMLRDEKDKKPIPESCLFYFGVALEHPHVPFAFDDFSLALDTLSDEGKIKEGSGDEEGCWALV